LNFCEDPKNEDKVVSTNLVGTANVLKVAEKYMIPTVMLSSDHVFSGKRWFLPYSEHSKPNPVNFYGHSKMSAEALRKTFDNFKIVRTSYLFDEQRLSRVGSVPDFMYRSFMYLPHFVKSFMYYLYNYEYMPSIVHIAGSKTVSWKKFMRSINPNHPFHSTDDLSLAPRPYKAGLRTVYNFFPKFSYMDGIREMTK
jgi:dTDP-4-dehydrorhamnose reductase